MNIAGLLPKEAGRVRWGLWLFIVVITSQVAITMRNLPIALQFWAGRVPDDAFYYISTAFNFADGYGSSFDRVNLTNGYHPLWFLLIAALKFLGLVGDDRVAAFYRLLWLQCVLAGFGYGFVFLFLRALTGRLLLSALVTLFLAFQLVFDMTNLLETPLQVGLVFATLTLLHHILRQDGEDTQRRLFELGACCALAFLARLDSVFLFVACGLVLLIRNRFSARDIAMFAAPFVFVTLVYVIVNQIEFGTPTPISASVKGLANARLFASNSLADYLALKLRFFFSLNAVTDVRGGQGWLIAGWLVPLLLFSRSIRRTDMQGATAATIFAAALYLALKYFGILFLEHGRRANSYWYWVVDYALSVTVSAYLAARLIEIAVKERFATGGILGMAAVLLAWQTERLRDVYRFHQWVITDSAGLALYYRGDTPVLYGLARFMAENQQYFSKFRIGSANTGILNYFSSPEIQVTNLDGLSNSKKLYVARRDLKLNEYINKNIDIIVEYHAGFEQRYVSYGYELYNVRDHIENPAFKVPEDIDPTVSDYRIYVRRDLMPSFEAFLASIADQRIHIGPPFLGKEP